MEKLFIIPQIWKETFNNYMNKNNDIFNHEDKLTENMHDLKKHVLLEEESVFIKYSTDKLNLKWNDWALHDMHERLTCEGYAYDRYTHFEKSDIQNMKNMASESCNECEFLKEWIKRYNSLGHTDLKYIEKKTTIDNNTVNKNVCTLQRIHKYF
jgi:hypothetical protein